MSIKPCQHRPKVDCVVQPPEKPGRLGALGRQVRESFATPYWIPTEHTASGGNDGRALNNPPTVPLGNLKAKGHTELTVQQRSMHAVVNMKHNRALRRTRIIKQTSRSGMGRASLTATAHLGATRPPQLCSNLPHMLCSGRP